MASEREEIFPGQSTPLYGSDSEESEDTTGIIHETPDISKDLPSRKLLNLVRRQSRYPSARSQRGEAEDSGGVDLKDASQSMEERRDDRRQTQAQLKGISNWKSAKYALSMKFTALKRSLNEALNVLDVLQNSIRHVEGHFGVGVASYFDFIRWLSLVNAFVFLLAFSFVVLPQILYRVLSPEGSGYEDMGWLNASDLMTGMGWLEHTELYYGVYGGNLSLVSGTLYRIPMAYFFTPCCFFLACFALVAWSTTKLLRKNYVESSDEFNSSSLLSQLLCGWDYGIINQKSAVLRHKAFNFTLKELYYRLSHKSESTLSQKCTLFLVRVGINILILAIIGIACIALHFLQDYGSFKNLDDHPLASLYMPLFVTGLMYILPALFGLLGSFENYERDFTKFIYNLVRVMILLISILIVMVYHWVEPVSSGQSSSSISCWETWIAQHIYQLIVMEFIFSIFHALLGELALNLCSKFIPFLDQPEFDIAGNTLRLIYSQMLCWLGHFISPLLSFIQCLKLVILFFIKRITVVNGCSPPKRSWRGARADFFFTLFLFVCLLIDLAVIICSWVFLPPSKDCGPFANFNRTTDIVSTLDNSSNTFKDIVKVLLSRGFAMFIITALFVVMVNFRVRAQALDDTIRTLRKNIALEGKDRAYLIKTFQQLQMKSPNRSAVRRTPRKSDVTVVINRSRPQSGGVNVVGNQQDDWGQDNPAMDWNNL